MKSEDLKKITRVKLREFAFDFYGIHMSVTGTRDVMYNKFLSLTQGIEPIKELPWARSKKHDPFAHIITNEEPVTKPIIEPVTEPVIEPVEELVANDPIIGPVEELVIESVESYDQPFVEEMPYDVISNDSPSIEEHQTNTDFILRPTFDLYMTGPNGIKYSNMDHQVIETIISLVDTNNINSIHHTLLERVLTVIWYARKLGSVTLRSSRDSDFYTFTDKDFNTIKV